MKLLKLVNLGKIVYNKVYLHVRGVEFIFRFRENAVGETIMNTNH